MDIRLIRPLLLKKMNLPLDGKYTISYNFTTKELKIACKSGSLTIESSMAKMLLRLKDATMRNLDDCKEPHFLIYESSGENDSLKIAYLNINNSKKQKSLKL